MPGRWAALTVACVLALASSLAEAAPAPGPACQGAQLQAAGAFLSKSFQCRSAFQKDPAGDPGGSLRLAPCLAKADAKLLDAFERALAKAVPGACGIEDAATLRTDLELEVDSLSFGVSEENLDLVRAEGVLHAKLHSAIAKALAGALKVESRHAKKPNEDWRFTKRYEVREALYEAFDVELAKAAFVGVVYYGLVFEDVADEVDRIADELASLTSPAGARPARSRARSSSLRELDAPQPLSLQPQRGGPRR